jgi:arylsulfatase A-like enzyme
MTKHIFTRLVSAAGLAAICTTTLAAELCPNLLIIATDEHNFRTLGCYRETLSEDQALMWGKSVVETPHIDRIAHEGALCTSFYASTPTCSPSRGSFVSGLYPQNSGVVRNDFKLGDHVVTFAQILKDNGYATGYSGKWHLDTNGKPGWTPEDRFGFDDNRYMFNRGHWKIIDESSGEPKASSKVGDEKTFTTDWLADKTIEFISTHKDKPFCYMVCIPDPHGPDKVREPYLSMYADQEYTQPKSATKSAEGLPAWGKMTSKSYNQSKYYGMVKCIDDNVGKILAHLEENGLMDNTVIVFTSDHGDLRGEHGKQNKSVPYDGSAQIPFVLRWPAKVKAGTIINESLGCADFLPTVLSLMDVKTTGKEDGRDASAMFTTGKAPQGWKDITFYRGTGWGGEGKNDNEEWVVAVSDRYKLIYSVVDKPWLFDLKTDPDEMVNQFSNPEYKPVVRDLSAAMITYGDKYNDQRVKNPKVAAELKQAAGQ